MPLMVDDSGRPLLANSLAALAIDAPSDIPQNDISTWAPTGTVTQLLSAPSAISSSSSVSAGLDNQSMEEIIKDQQAIQAGLDNQTPRNLMLAFGALLLLVMLLSHPRFLARLLASLKTCTKTQHILQDTPPNSATPLQSTQSRPVGGGDLRKGWLLRGGRSTKFLDSATPKKTNPFLTPFDDDLSQPSSSPPTRSPPPHIVPLLHHLPFTSTFFWAPFAKFPRSFASSVALPELYLITGYLVLNAFAMIWRSDVTPTTESKGYGYDFYRTGLVAMVQIPIAVALGVRGNIIGLCVGKGYERLKRFHKIVGQVLFVAASLHSLFYLHKFAVKGMVGKMLPKPFILAGFISWIAIVLIAVTAIPQVRNSCYGLFKMCHVAGIVILLIGMCYHVNVAVPWCTSAMIIYAISIVCSLTKTRLAHAELVALPGSNTTVITIPALQSGWRAGQHVRIRLPALRFPAGFEAHPLTIASAPDGEGMVLMCKAAGNWTQKIFDLASDPVLTMNNEKFGKRLMSTIILEGPYGGLGNTLLPSFSGVVLTAGGSGITQALALAHDLVTRAPTGVVRARTVDLIWAVRTEDAARPMMPTLIDMVEDARSFEDECLEGRKLQRDVPPPVALRVHVHITRCPLSSPITLLDRIEKEVIFDPFSDENGMVDLRRQPSAAEREKAAYISRSGSMAKGNGKGYYSPLSGIFVNKKRPDYSAILNDVVGEVIDAAKRNRQDPSGVCVTACGPAGMVTAVRDAVRDVKGRARRAVGGLELEEEQFGF